MVKIALLLILSTATAFRMNPKTSDRARLEIGGIGELPWKVAPLSPRPINQADPLPDGAVTPHPEMSQPPLNGQEWYQRRKQDQERDEALRPDLIKKL